MTYICGHIDGGMKPKALKSFRDHLPTLEYLNFTGDDLAYWNAVNNRWTGKEDLIILEQDIEITADTIPSLEACPKPWCTFEYACVYYNPFVREPEPKGAWTQDSLGCTKFSAELQRRFRLDDHPNPLDDAIHHWKNLDRFISGTMGFYHVKPHVHGRVAHHHEFQRADFRAAFQKLQEQ